MKVLALWLAVLLIVAALPGCMFDSVSFNLGVSDGQNSGTVGFTGHLKDEKEVREPKVIRQPKIARGTREKGMWHERLWTADNQPVVPFSE